MDMNYGGGEYGREGGWQDGVEWGGKWDNCNSIINKYILKKKKETAPHFDLRTRAKRSPRKPGHAPSVLEPTDLGSV